MTTDLSKLSLSELIRAVETASRQAGKRAELSTLFRTYRIVRSRDVYRLSSAKQEAFRAALAEFAQKL